MAVARRSLSGCGASCLVLVIAAGVVLLLVWQVSPSMGVRRLLRRVETGDAQMRLGAALELVKPREPPLCGRLTREQMAEVTDALVDGLCTPDPQVRRKALAGLELGVYLQESSGERAAEAATPFLADPDWEVRAAAAKALRQVGPWAGSARTALVAALTDSRYVREAAVAALADIDLGGDLPPSLEPLLTADEVMVRADAVKAAASVGPAAVPLLIPRLVDESRLVRSAAVTGISQCGPAVVPDLVKVAETGDVSERRAAIGVLEHMGSAAEEALPFLRKVSASDAEPGPVREAARHALARIDPARP